MARLDPKPYWAVNLLKVEHLKNLNEHAVVVLENRRGSVGGFLLFGTWRICKSGRENVYAI